MANLRHHDPFVRAEAALALGWMGGLAAVAVSELVLLIEAYRPKGRVPPQSVFRGGASDAVTPPAPPSTTPQSSEEAARINSIQALGRIGPGAASALGMLLEIAAREEEPYRSAAELAVAEIGSK